VDRERRGGRTEKGLHLEWGPAAPTAGEKEGMKGILRHGNLSITAPGSLSSVAREVEGGIGGSSLFRKGAMPSSRV